MTVFPSRKASEDTIESDTMNHFIGKSLYLTLNRKIPEDTEMNWKVLLAENEYYNRKIPKVHQNDASAINPSYFICFSFCPLSRMWWVLFLKPNPNRKKSAITIQGIVITPQHTRHICSLFSLQDDLIATEHSTLNWSQMPPSQLQTAMKTRRPTFSLILWKRRWLFFH